MTGVEIVREIVTILGAGISELGSAIGSGVANFAESLAFTTVGDSQQLSVYFILVIVFAGISLAVGLTTLIFNWLTNLGN